MQPHQIAQLLALVAVDTIEGRASIEVNTALTQALWAMAGTLGHAEALAQIFEITTVYEIAEGMTPKA